MIVNWILYSVMTALATCRLLAAFAFLARFIKKTQLMTEIINDPCHNTYESITVSAVVVHAGYDVH